MSRSSFLVLGLLLLLPIPIHAAQRHIVLKDGSTVEAASAVVVKGQVQLKLENGRLMAFDATDVDLKASGLLPAPATTTPSGAIGKGGQGRFGKAIAAKNDGETSPEITDRDVKHIWPGDEPSKEEAEESPTEPTVSLQVADLNKVLKDGILTLTGSVQNTGSEEVTAISITATAKDAEGDAVAQGTTGISSALSSGASKPFAIAMAVSGDVAQVTVKARAALSNFEFKEQPAPEKGSEEQP